MTYRTRLTVQHPKFSGTGIQVRISALGHPEDQRENFDGVATLNIETGPCSIQTYATPETLRTLAERLIGAAQVIEDAALIAEQEAA